MENEEIIKLKEQIKKLKNENEILRKTNNKLTKKEFGDGLEIVNITTQDNSITFELVSETYTTTSIFSFKTTMENKYKNEYVYLTKTKDGFYLLGRVESIKVYISQKRYGLQLKCNIEEHLQIPQYGKIHQIQMSEKEL